MDQLPNPVPSVADAKVFFQQLMEQLKVVQSKLAAGPERAQMDEVIRMLHEPLDSACRAAEEAEAQMAAMHQRAEQLLTAAAVPAPAALPAPESGAVLGPRLRHEVLQRYAAKPAPARVTAPPTSADRIEEGSVSRAWSETEVPEESTPLSAGKDAAPPPSKPAETPPQKPGPRRSGEIWEDLSQSEN
jgi:hypothetical protein